MFRTRTLAAIAATAVLLPALGLAAGTEPAAEAGIFDPDPRGDRPAPFYHATPGALGEPGHVLRTEAVRNPWNALGVNEVGAYRGARVLYTSTARDGARTAVSGVVIWPKAVWTGGGSRPVVAYAPGTQGMADDCAPSKALADRPFFTEQILFGELLKRGYAVVVTDYAGLGTPGTHTYMDRLAQGHALLDAARAARAVPGTGVAATSPVALAGYSQGGAAAASAAELAPTYAPDLPVKAVTAGGVPADLEVVARRMDGSATFAFLGYALQGMAASYGVDVARELTPAGRTVLQRITNSCTGDLALWSGRHLRSYTRDGSGAAELATREPYRTMLAQQRIGGTAPVAPVLLTHARGDDVIPFDLGRGLASDWCARGANVTFRPGTATSHVGGAAEHGTAQVAFITDAFAGRAQPGNCGR